MNNKNLGNLKVWAPPPFPFHGAIFMTKMSVDEARKRRDLSLKIGVLFSTILILFLALFGAPAFVIYIFSFFVVMGTLGAYYARQELDLLMQGKISSKPYEQNKLSRFHLSGPQTAITIPTFFISFIFFFSPQPFDQFLGIMTPMFAILLYTIVMEKNTGFLCFQ